MKKLLLMILVFSACSKDNGGGNVGAGTPNQMLLLGKFWRPYALLHNGSDDPTIFSRQPTYEFRYDGKLYINQAFPTYRDTFKFDFLNDINIKLTKPWVSGGFTGNVKIDRLTDSDFDFTTTNNQNADIDVFKSHKL